MKKLLVLLLIFSSLEAFCGPQFGAYGEYRIEKNSDGSISDRYPVGGFFGYHFDQFGVVGERIFFSSSTESSSTYVERRHEEYNLWVQIRYPINVYFLNYFGAGVGVNRDYILNRVLTAESETFGEWNGQVGLVYGVQVQMKPVFIAFEGRIQSIAGYSPNIGWSLGTKLGLEF